MSFCKIDNFVLYNLVIFFYLNLVYQDSWASVFLLLNISDVFLKKKISDGNRMLTGFECFPDLLQPLSIDAKSPKDVVVKNNHIKNVDVGDICIKGVCTKDTYTKSACIIDTYSRDTGVRVVCIELRVPAILMSKVLVPKTFF